MGKDTIEHKVYGWVADVGDRVGAERISGLLGSALVGVARTKARLDKNVDALLAVANIPSRADYRKMQNKLDSLQGSVMSLSRTVEQLRAALAKNGAGSAHSAARSRPRAASKDTKASSNGTGPRSRQGAKHRKTSKPASKRQSRTSPRGRG